MAKEKKYPPISAKIPHIIHGGDYNPDQWINTPEIWDEDMRLMKLAGCNTMTLGIFSWSMLEPEEGVFDFAWLDTIMDKLADNGIYAILSTPTGARPAWMAQKYPEVLRVEMDRQRIKFSGRHNHCFTSPIYREKASIINRKLAERYGSHPALIAWHISNEYSSYCHCPMCQEAFRDFLKQKYDNDLEKLNAEWWTGFWSRRFTDWSQIESPTSVNEGSLHALVIDWNRFVTHQTIDFYKNEIKPLRELTPDMPVTTNFMVLFSGCDYWNFAKEVDVVSWDSYPSWGTDQLSTAEVAANAGFAHDLYRSLKGGKPFMLMESTPSQVNWHAVNQLKRPGMHLLSSIQAVAHGSDTVQYFQWRKSRGASEKFHGAVVDHCGHEHTRVFRDVAELGEKLKRLDGVVGTTVRPEVAIIYEWDNLWAMGEAQALKRTALRYKETCFEHYNGFWKQGVPVDIINMKSDLSGYKLVIAPMLYMVKPGFDEKIEAFVKGGGSFVTTYWSGRVNENDLCYLGGFPGPLRRLLGVWAEEIDSLYDSQSNSLVISEENELGLSGKFEVHDFCDLFMVLRCLR